MRIVFTPSARDQFLNALAYIQRENLAAAHSFRKKAEMKLSRLAEFPEFGRRLPEFPDLSFREIIIPSYRFCYRIKEKTVWVAAVWHDAQLPDEPDTL